MNPTILLDHDAPEPGGPLVVRALLTVDGEAPDDRSRVPLNLSLVLDRSGSMAGEKLEAAVDAAALLVRRLWPDDRVSVVVYDDEAVVVAEPGRGAEQTDLTPRLRRIEPRGCTNLSGGWLRGRELVNRHVDRAGVNRILLLTDGLANQGITDPGALARLFRTATLDGISTTTIGFGADFDERLLRTLADAGGGNAWYIEESEQAPGVFEEEMEGLLSLTAQNLTVEVRTAEAARLTLVHHSYPRAVLDDGVRLELGDLYAREPKRLLLEMLVAEPPAGGEGRLATLTLAGDVLTPGGGVERRTVTLPLTLSAADGPRVVPEVRRELLLAEAGRAREEALERRDRGDQEGATRRLREASEEIQRYGFTDNEVAEEVADLQSMAERLDGAVMEEADAKYLYQRAYEATRGKRFAKERIRRERGE